ncbi:MAG: ABC transporter ATP-binding protein [Betaproteobacteria bacterium]|jgi:simple sugar transport system ATP-binding protein
MTTVTAEPPPYVETRGLAKRFGSVQALCDASVRFAAGRVHALLGENGAGKSTLVKCVVGYYRADAGTILVNGAAQPIRSPQQSRALGLGMVYQHFTLVSQMTVAENLVLGRTHLPAAIDWAAEHRALRDFMRPMPFRLDPARLVASLAAGEKQKLEILKQLYLGRRFLVLDEPTSVLTPDESDQVLAEMRRLADEGRLTVVLITHKLREVMRYAQDVSVMRGGRILETREVATTSADALARLMFGQDASLAAPAASHPDRTRGAVGVRVDKLQAVGDRGTLAVADVSFDVHRGEILGIAGVSGNGQKELVEVLAGQREPSSGAIAVDGAPYARTRPEMQRHGVFLLTEEPLQNDCIRSLSVMANLALRRFDRPPIAWHGWLRRGAMRRWAERLIARYRIRTPSPLARIDSLSGGNVQRAVLARELSEDVGLLILQNPCFGLDAAAVAEIRGQIAATRDRGAAVLLVSEDLDEILELADRIVVMSGGRIVHEVDRAQADRYALGRHMARSAEVEAA